MDQQDINPFIEEFVHVFEAWSADIESKAKVFGRNRNEYVKEAQSS